MNAITWAPGSRADLDKLFDNLREQRYQDHNHRLWKNYGKEAFDSAVALTIQFDDNGNPEGCSSIASRDCWPAGAYRISNRYWKHSNKLAMLKHMTRGYANIIDSQLAWLRSNVDCKMYFVSRESTNWMEWSIQQFKDHVGVELKTNSYKYLTCPNECDDTCWQHIIYNGDEELLKGWKCRL